MHDTDPTYPGRNARHDSFRPELLLTRTFPSGRRYEARVRSFLRDLADHHGLPELNTVRRNSFTEMTESVLTELRQAPTDLVVLAHSTPDAEPVWPGTFLSSALPGDPLAFALADSGVIAAFLALRIVDDYARTRSAVMLVLDQTAVLPQCPAAVETPSPIADSLVAIRFAPADAKHAPYVRNWPDVAASRVADVVGAEVRDLRRILAPTVVILGSGLAQQWTPPDHLQVMTATSGLVCTGPWVALAEGISDGSLVDVRVLVADYDVTTRGLGLCVLDTSRLRVG